MTDDEIKEKIKVEESTTETQTEEPIEPEIVSETIGGETVEGEIKEAPPDQGPEEPCDPATMSCNQMRDHIIDLSSRRATLNVGIKSLDDTRKIIPSNSLDKAFDESVAEKDKIDDEIYGLFERFTVCTTKPEEPEKPHVAPNSTIGDKPVNEFIDKGTEETKTE